METYMFVTCVLIFALSVHVQGSVITKLKASSTYQSNDITLAEVMHELKTMGMKMKMDKLELKQQIENEKEAVIAKLNHGMVDVQSKLKEKIEQQKEEVIAKLNQGMADIESNLKEKIDQEKEEVIKKMNHDMGDVESKLETHSKHMVDIELNLEKKIQEDKKDIITQVNNNKDMMKLIKDAVDRTDIIFYPPGTTTHIAHRHYPQYALDFIGFGYGHCHASTGKGDISLEVCLEYCKQQHDKDNRYTGLDYDWKSISCNCCRGDHAHVVYRDRLHYRFP